jgi:hypothetical protein
MKSIFISYCHEPIYGDLIQAFVDKLLKLGIPAINDKYDLSPGNDLDVFMSDIVDREKYKKILVFCTAKYKEKADNNEGGVGQESKIYEDIVKNSPNQEYVIPIIIEPNIEAKELLPNIFPKNTYYFDLSNDLKFTNEQSLDLIHYLQGIRPRKPQTSVLEALVTYTLANFPGLPKPLIDLFKQEMSKWIVSTFTSSFGTMIKFNTWIDINNEYEILERLAPDIIEFTDSLSNPYVTIDLLSIFWKYFDNIPNNVDALKIIDRAVFVFNTIKDKNTNTQRIKLNLEFKRAISLHRMNLLDDALKIYKLITDEESQDLLDPVTVFNAALYAGHIYKLKLEILKSDKFYNDVIISCEQAHSQNIPLEIYYEIRQIQHIALNSLENKSDEHLQIIERNKIKDQHEYWGNITMSNSLYPKLFALPIKLIPC